MINLFETFNKDALLLHESLIIAGFDHPTVVIEDDGFLDETFLSPYQFFSDLKKTYSDKPLFFNQLELPDFWEIEGSNEAAVVKDMGKEKAHIVYRKNFMQRIISSVSWLDDSGRKRCEEHYHRYGFKYAETVFGRNGEKKMKIYFCRNGSPVIYENYITGNIMLSWHGKDYFFINKVDFLLFYIEISGLNIDSIIFNSLGLPYSISYHLSRPGQDTLFWQEHIYEALPGNMQLIFNNDRKRRVRILVPNKAEFEIICSKLNIKEKSQIFQSGYLYRFHKNPQYGNHVLTVTNSDQLVHITEIVTACPELEFHIAAITEMSSKLHDLEQYNNVHLHPGASIEEIRNLFLRCDIYLDINNGNEIVNAVRSAFDYNMPVLSFKETCHNHAYTSDECLFEMNDYKNMIEKLKNITVQNDEMDKVISAQHDKANMITPLQFTKSFQY